MHLTGREAAVANAAAATVRQLVASVVDRALKDLEEPGRFENLPAADRNELKSNPKIPPKSLTQCCADAYMLFQVRFENSFICPFLPLAILPFAYFDPFGIH